MCGGPAKGFNQTEDSLTNLATQQGQLQDTAFQTALPQEQSTLTSGIQGLDVATGDINALTAKNAAPAMANESRQLAVAGIDPSDPRAIAAKNQLNETTGQNLSQNTIQALIQQFMAKSGAAKDLLNFGSSQNPLAALSTLIQAQLQA